MSNVSPQFYLNKAAQAHGDVTPVSGQSGYFSTPEIGLDPVLFNGDSIRLEVAEHIRRELYTFWLGRYRNPHTWSRLWLAGSGISYQWAAARGNGDLDVMVGIDAAEFRASNPIYGALSNAELADHINGELKAWLWPSTAETEFGGKIFEVTYYWNQRCTADPYGVENIHPYAAYDLISLSWAIRPPKLPVNPRKLYPREWWQAADSEADTARRIISRYNAARERAAVVPSGSPGQINALTAMRLAASQAADLFDSIHTGRKAAFGPGGSGYGDWANFRWQAHKQDGTVMALAEIVNVSRAAVADASMALYGGPVESASVALPKALMWANQGGAA
ncbi:hypothetical protein [Nonomuraea typhae]|uniref:Nucleotidyltransferase n=1 Tax=Nonomuraea typhae TaxID=2603600 RepID=A0ABW7YJ88_9ACTN